MDKFICSKCGNANIRYLGKRNNQPYCRRCITFQGEEAVYSFGGKKYAEIAIDYKLSNEQNRVSKRVLENYQEGKNTLIYAVCGAGKTELVYEVIKHVLINGGKIGFSVPRRDVVIELYPRIKNAFSKNHVIAVYGGHHTSIYGDIIVLTTHQLYRYENYFDLLIVDEIDAFPYRNNDLLEGFFKRSIRGQHIIMTATPSNDILNKYTTPDFDLIKLMVRFHEQPLPVPKIRKNSEFAQIFCIIRKIKAYRRMCIPVLVFAPTIKICSRLYWIISLFVNNGNFVHSKCKHRDAAIKNFKIGKISFLVTTSVLERGVTVKNLQVLIFKADHEIYTKEALVQIAGRVGRKIGAEKGDVIFFAKQTTKQMEDAISDINSANQVLQDMLSRD